MRLPSTPTETVDFTLSQLPPDELAHYVAGYEHDREQERRLERLRRKALLRPFVGGF